MTNKKSKNEQATDILEMIRERQKIKPETSKNKLKEFIDSLGHEESWDPAVAAYIAAFIDADGSVSLASKGGKDKFRTPCVEFYNNDYLLMSKIARTVGMPGGVTKRTRKNSNHADSYELRVTGDKALDVLYEVKKFMLHTKKKQRVDLITTHYKKCTPRNGKYTEDQLEMKKWLEESVMSIQMRGKEVDNLA